MQLNLHLGLALKTIIGRRIDARHKKKKKKNNACRLSQKPVVARATSKIEGHLRRQNLAQQYVGYPAYSLFPKL